jgi:hypothetical protein
MPIETRVPEKLQVRLTSAAELRWAALEPYLPWIEEAIGVPLSETVTIELDCNPGDAIAGELLPGLPIVSSAVARNNSWQSHIEAWSIPPGVSPRFSASAQRERKPNAPPFCVWDLDWKDCPIALRLRGLSHQVISIKVPIVFPPCDTPVVTPGSSQHWFIAHREDATKLLRMRQQIEYSAVRYLETGHGYSQLQGRYDWEAVVLDATTRRLVKTDFELFFKREEWFRQHNLPYRRGYLLWGPPGNGKSATIRIMAAHPHIQAYALDLSDAEEKSSRLFRLFEKAAMSAPALVILEDLDRAFPSEGKRTTERMVSFQTLLNCLDGVGTQDGVIVVATANNPTCLDAAILKRPGRFDRVVQFRNPDEELRREYYRRFNPILAGEQFEIAINRTEGFSFAQLRETYILGAQSAFENGREIKMNDVTEAIELQAAGAHQLKTSVAATGFVIHSERAIGR